MREVREVEQVFSHARWFGFEKYRHLECFRLTATW